MYSGLVHERSSLLDALHLSQGEQSTRIRPVRNIIRFERVFFDPHHQANRGEEDMWSSRGDLPVEASS